MCVCVCLSGAGVGFGGGGVNQIDLQLMSYLCLSTMRSNKELPSMSGVFTFKKLLKHFFERSGHKLHLFLAEIIMRLVLNRWNMILNTVNTVSI